MESSIQIKQKERSIWPTLNEKISLPSSSCIICYGKKIHYVFSVGQYRVEECINCGMMRLNPQPNNDKLTKVYCTNKFSAEYYLNILESYVGSPLQGKLLEIGCVQSNFLQKASEHGLEVTGSAGDITQLVNQKKEFDYVVFANILDCVSDPRLFLKNIHSLLKKDGIIVAIIESLDSSSTRKMQNNWVEFIPEHLWYFSIKTLKRLFYSENFGNLHIHQLDTTNSQNDTMIIGSKKQIHPIKKLSVVMAVFNEVKTIQRVLDKIIAKQLEDMIIEIIIVESNSTDGTKEILQKYESHPEIKIIWQDKPNGKGNAIRKALEYVTGDYILIQDADEEYDIEDYDALLEPLLTGEAAFVLGARHGGRTWKMRKFSDQKLASNILNFGHWFFALLLNIFFGLKLNDPFTMYKVFRADCLQGLTFECNRFDFDFELVIKIVKNGYCPLEIPVNYRSRSFKEGKKIQVIKDPLTWLWLILKLKLQKI